MLLLTCVSAKRSARIREKRRREAGDETPELQEAEDQPLEEHAQEPAEAEEGGGRHSLCRSGLLTVVFADGGTYEAFLTAYSGTNQKAKEAVKKKQHKGKLSAETGM